MAYYEKVLSIDSTQSEAHYYLADCFRYLFEYEKALTHYQRVDANDKARHPLLMFNLGITHKSLGHYSEATNILQQFVQSVADDDEYRYWQSRAKVELEGIQKTQNAPFTPVLNVKVRKLP
ncbi:MAG: tetratricopeptide repeat protein, partial [Cyclobacteriaceae bacterium]